MRFRNEKIDNKFLKIAQEHEVVIRHIKALREIVDKKDLKEGVQLFKEFLPTLTNDMKHHFKIEERFIFPAALLSMPEIEIVDLITVMIKEHGYLERDLSVLQTYTAQDGQKNNLDDRVVGMLEQMIKDIEKHAKTEMDHIFPKMDANKRCRKIIKGILLE